MVRVLSYFFIHIAVRRWSCDITLTVIGNAVYVSIVQLSPLGADTNRLVYYFHRGLDVSIISYLHATSTIHALHVCWSSLHMQACTHVATYAYIFSFRLKHCLILHSPVCSDANTYLRVHTGESLVLIVEVFGFSHNSD